MVEDEHKFDQMLSIPSDPAEGLRIQALLLDKLKQHGFPEKVVFGIKLALEEAIVNAIKHGNQMDRNKKVHVSYTINNEHFLIQIRDEGPGFCPDEIPDPTSPENLERPCGRGLFLMKAYMTDCEFLPPGNICRMRRVRS